MKQYYKLFNDKEKHFDMQYKDGLNTDILPFNNNPNASCCEGGLYFTDKNNIFDFIDYDMRYIRKISVPRGCKIIKDPDGDKYRAHKLYLEEKHDLLDPETWKWMKEEGIKFTINDAFIDFLSKRNDTFNVIKFLYKTNTNIFTETIWISFEYACYYSNNMKTVKYLFNKMKQNQHVFNIGFLNACKGSSLNTIKFLFKYINNIHNIETDAIYYILSNQNYKAAEYLLSNGLKITKKCISDLKHFSEYYGNKLKKFVETHK